ncbi:aldehyde dehydrogenase [Aspergillus pseudoustus]|uniref:aldehyde dehydrogenase (NAD(+)) n=1 Tax=Aspergillus pseudoustus TaxID=1810923 RepID=A0ABR4JPX5_9EURO
MTMATTSSASAIATVVGPLDFTTFSNIIDGKRSDTEISRYGINPATNEPLFPAPVSTPADVHAAIAAARVASKTWKKSSVEDRKKRLRELSAALISYKAEFARLLTTEQGKPTVFAEQEVDFGAYWLAGTCELDLPEQVVEGSAERFVRTRYVPLGVAVGIVPWNFPIMLLCGKLGPALLTGNTIIIKPSPFTPYCGIKIVELAQCYFPAGVVQVLSGDDNLGPWLTAHPGIDKISLTGSTATGKRVMESASRNLTRVTLELGGNDAAIVCADVDVDTVAGQVAQAAFLNSGQICIAIKRVYVHANIYIAFRCAFVNHVAALKVGNGFEPGTFLGPVQNKLQYERVQVFLEDAAKQNQSVLTGGSVLESSEGDTDKGRGFFVQPTVIDNPSDDSKIVVEEPFGPVVPLLQWSGVEEVIARVNASDMGLGASVWTKDRSLAVRIAEELDVGSVWVNEHLSIRPTAAFAGHKKSGIGSEWGVDGLKAYCNTQTIFSHKASE